MLPDGFPVGAAVLLAVSAALLVNPLYLQEDDRGNQIVTVEASTAAEGVARQSPAVRRRDDLPVVARHAVRRGLETGSFRVDRDGPPLALQLLAVEGRFVASHRTAQVYEPTVTVGANRTTLSLTAVPVEAVEAELGVTPPAGLDANRTVRRVAWLADRSEAVYAVGQFGDRWSDRLSEAVAAGELTVQNGNDASTLAPLDGAVEFVAAGGTAYRATVETADRSVRLGLTPVSAETLLAETGVAVVPLDSLSPATQAVVEDALRDEDHRARFAHEDVDSAELERLGSSLLRREGTYYLVRRTHVDGFSLLPLIRAGLMALGGVVGFAGVVLLYRQTGWASRTAE